MEWRRSSRCDNSLCVEVSLGDRALVRDAAYPEVWLSFSRRDWATFMADLPRREGSTA